MAIDDVARVMFRFGLRDLPIIDGEGRLVRDHLEPRHRPLALRAGDPRPRRRRSGRCSPSATSCRSRPDAAWCRSPDLTPTQWKVFEDELEGRRYELERGFAEPVLVLQKGEQWILVDGHHRALAAREMGLTRLQAFILAATSPEEFATVETGLETVAKEHHLCTLDDIDIDRTAHHPLVEVTTQLLRRFEPEESARKGNGG